MTTAAGRARQVRGWMRRNVVALIAIIVLLPATIAITFATEWGSYNQSRASQPITATIGETTDFGRAEWMVESVDRVYWASDDGIDAGLPSGSELIVVTVAVTPGELDDDGQSTYCSTRLVDLDGGAISRQWSDAQYASISWESAAGAEASCAPELTTPYTMEALFVVPQSTEGDLALVIELVDELPKFLQVSLAL